MCHFATRNFKYLLNRYKILIFCEVLKKNFNLFIMFTPSPICMYEYPQNVNSNRDTQFNLQYFLPSIEFHFILFCNFFFNLLLKHVLFDCHRLLRLQKRNMNYFYLIECCCCCCRCLCSWLLIALCLPFNMCYTPSIFIFIFLLNFVNDLRL